MVTCQMTCRRSTDRGVATAEKSQWDKRAVIAAPTLTQSVSYRTSLSVTPERLDSVVSFKARMTPTALGYPSHRTNYDQARPFFHDGHIHCPPPPPPRVRLTFFAGIVLVPARCLEFLRRLVGDACVLFLLDVTTAIEQH